MDLMVKKIDSPSIIKETVNVMISLFEGGNKTA